MRAVLQDMGKGKAALEVWFWAMGSGYGKGKGQSRQDKPALGSHEIFPYWRLLITGHERA